MKKGPELAPGVVIGAIVLVVAVVGYFFWSSTNKKVAATQDTEKMKAAMERIHSGQGMPSSGGSGSPGSGQMQDAMNRMRSGQGMPSSGR